MTPRLPAVLDRIESAFKALSASRNLTSMNAAASDLADAFVAKVAGLESRYYVKAAMHPTYTNPDSLDFLVKAVAVGGTPFTRGLTRGERAGVAVAAIRGWVEHQDRNAA